MRPLHIYLALSLFSLTAAAQYQRPPEDAQLVYPRQEEYREETYVEERAEEAYGDLAPEEYRPHRRQYEESEESSDSAYRGEEPVYAEERQGGYEQKSYEKPGKYDHSQVPQYNPQHHQHGGSEMEAQYNYAYKHSHGTCDIKRNPHSYGCTEWTFTNNKLFPLFRMNWDDLQGEWFMITWISSKPLPSDEFAMGINPNSPGQPMGVVNIRDNSLVGKMKIRGREVVFENWNGRRVSSEKSSFKVVDKYTVRFDMYIGAGKHRSLNTFHCRDFNRNDKHHVLCDWWEKTPQYWVKRGYIGFLTMKDWNGFLKHGVR